jgi:DNA-binding Lrp family transcriptional regulator
MVTAVVLLTVQRERITAVAEALAEMPEVTEVYSVAGKFDLVALVRVRVNEDLADLVTDRMVRLEGILDTETLIAFRAYARRDLDAGFALGAEG